MVTAIFTPSVCSLRTGLCLRHSGCAALFSTCFLTLGRRWLKAAPPRPILFGSRSKQTVMDVHPGWLSTVIGASGCYDPSRGPAVMRAITVSSHSPLVVTVTQTLSIAAVFSASSIFVLLPFFFFFLGHFPLNLFFFFYLFICDEKEGGGGAGHSQGSRLLCLRGTRSTWWAMRHPQSNLFFLHSIHSSLFHLPVLFRLTDVSLRRRMCAPD